jgi:nucleoside-diphosphate-sugar epimerase
MKGLIGYTGFVGGNLLKQSTFDRLYNSKNIQEIRGEKFNSIICAGAPAVKWKANKFPEEDMGAIQGLIDNLKEVECEHFILISTVDVYLNPTGIDEKTEIDLNSLSPYGKHRYMLEQFVTNQFPHVTVIRLPGLFGQGLKKNIIYDFIHNNCIDVINSENVFQFYNLERLYRDIETTLKNNISLINFATEPVSVKEVAKHAFDMDFTQVTQNEPVLYDMKTVFDRFFENGQRGYIATKNEVLAEIRQFVENEQKGYN